MSEEPTIGSVAGRRRQGGPHPGILAAVSLGIFLLSLVLALLLPGGRVFMSPFAPANDVAQSYRDSVLSVRLQGMLLFGSAVPLGIFAATVYARQLRLGVRVPGPAIGYFGGIAAATFLMLSGLLTWLLSRPEVTSDAVLTQAMAFLAFATGGVGSVTGLGLLVAGLAVPSLVLRFIPRWLAWAGLVIAALSELSFLSLAVEPLQFLLPIGRFGGMLWLVAVGFQLPVNRAAATRSPGSPGRNAGSGPNSGADVGPRTGPQAGPHAGQASKRHVRP
ncbi:hypothetical protein [Arthrobacter wenxiniae]|jgi:hypothetical protein|uniref:hypothetical protein n=1 Tax=Arthrobacter wenxiniae TaxID=2713570 RepID=UPI00159D37E9|nr:hypothetical protein [Arthrobacter wenxiniae]